MPEHLPNRLTTLDVFLAIISDEYLFTDFRDVPEIYPNQSEKDMDEASEIEMYFGIDDRDPDDRGHGPYEN